MSEKSQPAAATEPELQHSVLRPRDEPGIPLTSLVPEIAPMFLPFYTIKPAGMGMGLAIRRTIVTDHGGRLEAAPGPGGGADFTFTLPVVASETLS
jgi:two-component system sensor kinase FixL